MGFYIRKAIKVGPLRFNLSKSGIGVSAGVKGLRFGTGPRGNYVHMGRGGVYFRQTLGAAQSHRATPAPKSLLEAADPSTGPFEEIESGSVQEMADSSSADLLGELNVKRRKMSLLPFVMTLSAVGVFVLLANAVEGWIVGIAAVSALGLCWFASGQDALRKTTVIFYNLDADAEQAFAYLHGAFAELKSCSRLWHVDAKAAVLNSKYHAGAGTLIKRRVTPAIIGQPKFIKSNVEVPMLSAGRQVLAFMPDRLLVIEPSAVGAVSYADLELEWTETRFIEDESVPSDATVIDKTWRYVNKSGGPDRRFNNNRELPVCAYSMLKFTSHSGLNEVFHMSSRSKGKQQANAIEILRTVSLNRGLARNGNM